MFVAPDIIQVEIPLPFPLKIVNCYLVSGPDGWALIDTGINWPPALQAWHAALQRCSLVPADICEIYVTHYHPDHVGLAGWWQQQSGAPVFMTPVEARTARDVWSDGPRTGDELASLFQANGMPEALATAVAQRAAATQQMTEPLPEMTMLEQLAIEPPAESNVPDAPLVIAGRPFQPLVLPGHADEHLCLYEPATRTLLAADHVLPRISPNISLLPHTRRDPLGRYLRSLALLAALDVSITLPGHGPAFNDLRGRLVELHNHHIERLREIAAAMGSGATAYEVALWIFPMTDLSPHQAQFAMGETLAHLEYIVAQGQAERVATLPVLYRMAS